VASLVQPLAALIDPIDGVRLAVEARRWLWPGELNYAGKQALVYTFIRVHGAGFQIGFMFLGLGSTVFSYLIA